ncbi:unnamed protein product, partial [Soboliphyme baturini]|uniref:RING-type domain-containing protein n=1 Tax=Soboliphyme baturini TaxID=241478 RepID=A0A183IPU5_9BILA
SDCWHCERKWIRCREKLQNHFRLQDEHANVKQNLKELEQRGRNRYQLISAVIVRFIAHTVSLQRVLQRSPELIHAAHSSSPHNHSIQRNSLTLGDSMANPNHSDLHHSAPLGQQLHNEALQFPTDGILWPRLLRLGGYFNVLQVELNNSDYQRNDDIPRNELISTFNAYIEDDFLNQIVLLPSLEITADMTIEQRTCAICLNVQQHVIILPCHHLFHPLCIEIWLKIKMICPTCGRPVNPTYALVPENK